MKVLLFTDSDVFAGTEGHMFDLATGLRGACIEVLIGCPVPGALATRAGAVGLEVVPIAKHGLLDWRAVLRVRRICRGRGVDIIHCHNGRTAFLATVATLFASRVRLVVTQHFLTPSRVSRTGLRAMVSNLAHRWVDHRTGHLIAISSAVCRGSIERGEVTAEKITVIRNGVAEPDRATLRPVSTVRKEMGVAAEAPLIVCAARLEPEKDVATLIEAMDSVVGEVPEAVCVIAGDGRLREDLQKRIDGKGLQRSVRLLGFCQDVCSIVNACDLFVLPSFAEPFGLVLVEAMALGRPVIATAAGGPLEIVEDGRTGLLVQPRSAVEMAAAIGRILASPELRKTMGRLGEAKYRAEFTVDRMARETIAVYRRLVPHLVKNPADRMGAAPGVMVGK
jgi:glycosyltransferase involved in cell wall biosynthesis